MRIFYVELDDSGYPLSYLVTQTSEQEVRRRMQQFIADNRIANGRAKILKVIPLTDKPVDVDVYRFSKPEQILNLEEEST